MDDDWDLQLRRAKIYRLIMGVLRPTRFPLHDHDDDDTSKHCKDCCLVTRLHRPYIALPLWFSQNHVTDMDDLRETIFGSSAHKGGSSSSFHRLKITVVGCGCLLHTKRSSTRLDANRTQQHQAHLHGTAPLPLSTEGMPRLVYYLPLAWQRAAQNLHFNEFERQPRSSKEGKVAHAKMLVPNLDHQGFLSYMKDSILRSSSPSYLFLYIVY